MKALVSAGKDEIIVAIDSLDLLALFVRSRSLDSKLFAENFAAVPIPPLEASPQGRGTSRPSFLPNQSLYRAGISRISKLAIIPGGLPHPEQRSRINTSLPSL